MALFRTFDEIMVRRQTLSKRTVQTTVLLVGEGDTEKAFLDYLKSLYVTRGCGVSVTVRNAHGKGPMNVVDTAIRQSRTGEYKVVAVLMDTDLLWTDDVIKLARKHRLCLIGATPCTDGLVVANSWGASSRSVASMQRGFARPDEPETIREGCVCAGFSQAIVGRKECVYPGSQ